MWYFQKQKVVLYIDGDKMSNLLLNSGAGMCSDYNSSYTKCNRYQQVINSNMPLGASSRATYLQRDSMYDI